MPLRRAVVLATGLTCLAVVLSGCSRRGSRETSALELPEIRRISRGGGPHIRALVVERGEAVTLGVSGPVEIRQGSIVLARGSKLQDSPVRMIHGDAPHLQIGTLDCPPGGVEIVPERINSLRVRGHGPKAALRQYDGTLSLVPRGAASFDVINSVHLEQYLPAVLQAELYPGWHIETYRAQAIAARTYALYQMQTFGLQHDFDVRSTEASQVYKGGAAIPPESKTARAVRDTRGIVCSWSSPIGEKIFCTYFSSACGGRTQDAALVFNGSTIPPLAGGVTCTYCRIGGKAYRWGPTRISKQELTRQYLARFPQHRHLGTIQKIEPIHWGIDGRPLRLTLRGSGSRAIEADSYQFRLAIGGHRLRSNHFEIADLGSAFEFRKGRGFGHSVGLCQWGAEGQSRIGRKASEILDFYYPKSKLRRAY